LKKLIPTIAAVNVKTTLIHDKMNACRFTPKSHYQTLALDLNGNAHVLCEVPGKAKSIRNVKLTEGKFQHLIHSID
jgi:hypothetical protein